ncbi:MAG: HAMP domain-containing protein [Methylococcales bacterium]|nr:HAMP domain-containing protein [Methylococcales bacterium]
MDKRTLKIPVNLFIIILFGLILSSLQLMSSASQETSHLSDIYSLLILINTLGSVALLGLIGINVYSLARELKKKEAGSRLTTRMVSLFVLLALVPASIVFYFSIQFLHQAIDSRFNVEIGEAMEDALELSQASLDQQMRWHLKQTQRSAQELDNQKETILALKLGSLRESLAALEITLFSKQARIIAFSSVNTDDILPTLPDEYVWIQLRQDKHYIRLNTNENDGLNIQVLTLITGDEPRYLQAIYPIPVRISDLADSIEFASVRYQEMNFLRDSLKKSFLLALLLVLLLSLLAAIWIAFVSIRHIISPVKELVKGTKAVADGHYEQLLPVMAQDDLGFLVESFNQMTQRIAHSRNIARTASLEVEQQRAYLESILENVNAGVISFDSDFKIRTSNEAAYRILHCNQDCFSQYSKAQVGKQPTELVVFFDTLLTLVKENKTMWQQHITFLGGSRPQELLCRGKPLFSQKGVLVGAVVVFDDLTDLIQAQKNAAWGEVARRLAHEIKNPLTPIQLAAERLQHKLSNELSAPSAIMLQKSTHTIVQQVEAMKRMVNDFSEYARPAKKQTETLDLQHLVQELLVLYQTQENIQITFENKAENTWIQADPVTIRQVLHNLLKNAQEAMKGRGLIEIKLASVERHNAHYVELGVYDHGSGVNSDKIETVFEPYVTSKVKGTGLGLAIVKKIIEEHEGMIWVDSHYKQGAGFVFQLPCLS